MDQTKPWYKSSGIWGGAIAAGSGLAGVFGYSLSVEDQARLVASASQAAELASSVAALGGGLMAIVGRVRASRTIRGSASAKSG